MSELNGTIVRGERHAEEVFGELIPVLLIRFREIEKLEHGRLNAKDIEDCHLGTLNIDLGAGKSLRFKCADFDEPVVWGTPNRAERIRLIRIRFRLTYPIQTDYQTAWAFESEFSDRVIQQKYRTVEVLTAPLAIDVKGRVDSGEKIIGTVCVDGFKVV